MTGTTGIVEVVTCTPATDGASVEVVPSDPALKGELPRLSSEPPHATPVSTMSTRAAIIRRIVPPYSLISPHQS